jgi:fructose-bisphosphate aldolase, class I
MNDLAVTASALVAKKKGILAADESTGTITKRFNAVNVGSTEENRRDYREMLFRTKGISEFISGVILYDETIRQKAADGRPLVSILQQAGIIPGIKVDKGAKSLAGTENELVTEGLDGLRERFEEYYQMGARFAKWRAALSIGKSTPSDYCITVNAHALARYARLSHEAGLVPIVEPEVLMDGRHSIDDCFAATERTLREVFCQVTKQGVALEGCLLKPNMVISGKESSSQALPEEVGQKTVACLMRTVPAAVPGIIFLSGGQSDEESVTNLNAISLEGTKVGAPWELSYSYARGLQATPLKVWAGEAANVPEAQKAFYQRCLVTSQARSGNYK